MLIGQDPTIRKNPGLVTHVLMLNKSGAIQRWLKDVFGDKLNNIDIYATNAVKCTFAGDLPSERKGVTGHKFLSNYFHECKMHLINEIVNYKPDFVVSFGEPAHMLLTEHLLMPKSIPAKMISAFTGNFHDTFIEVNNEKISFKYSPCLHITTFRVADTYGERVKTFKSTLVSRL
jgi:uracil-DNA glycosylase